MSAYEIAIQWKDGLRGEATPGGVPHALPFSAPKEFGGPGGEWTPEHLFAAAVGTCVTATFLSIAQASKLAIAGYECKAICAMEKSPEGLRVTGFTLEPKVSVSAEKDVERARRMIEKAEKMCPISNGVKAPVTVRATVEVRA